MPNEDFDQLVGDIFNQTGRDFSAHPLMQILRMNAKSGSSAVLTGDEVAYRDDDSQQILLPKGMTLQRLHDVSHRLAEDSLTVTEFHRTFRYRPHDGAYATAMVLKELYGMTVGEKVDMGFLGTKNPETIDVTIELGKTVQVPWGRNSIPKIADDFFFELHQERDNEYGTVFGLLIEAPKMYKSDVDRIFAAIEEYLRTNSIYRGRAIVGTNRPEFLDLSSFDPAQVVFSSSVSAAIDNSILAYIRHADAFRAEGISLKRAILLYGPYGTGKTSTGMLTALEAVRHGWTFISIKPGETSVEDAIKTGKLYGPAVVFIEDIDNDASDEQISKLLEAFDGISAKGGELIVVMTSNHIDRIHKGMLRPGRLDAVIEVNDLDRAGVERLVRVVIPASKLASDIDFDAVFEAMQGYLPAFIREALDRVKSFAINRGAGSLGYHITTEDLVAAATSLRAQFNLLNDAGEGKQRPTLDTAIRDAVVESAQQAVHGTRLDIDKYELRVPALNGGAKH